MVFYALFAVPGESNILGVDLEVGIRLGYIRGNKIDVEVVAFRVRAGRALGPCY